VRIARHQAAEVGHAVGIAADDLRVDDAWREAAQRRPDCGEAARDVLAALAEDGGAAVMPVELRAPAVVLHLVQPVRPRGRGTLQDGG
jgi:hypothetical protein